MRGSSLIDNSAINESKLVLKFCNYRFDFENKKLFVGLRLAERTSPALQSTVISHGLRLAERTSPALQSTVISHCLQLEILPRTSLFFS